MIRSEHPNILLRAVVELEKLTHFNIDLSAQGSWFRDQGIFQAIFNSFLFEAIRRVSAIVESFAKDLNES
jgi:hypothetical protein